MFQKKNRTGAASFLAASGWQPRNYSEQLQTPGGYAKALHILGMETLNVAGMIRAGLQTKALEDHGISGLLRQVRYHIQWYGTRMVEAGQGIPAGRPATYESRADILEIVQKPSNRNPI